MVLFVLGGINKPRHTNVRVSSHPCECAKSWIQTPQLGCLAPTKAVKSQAPTLTFISWPRSQHLYKRGITSKGFFALSFACLWLSRSSLVTWPYQVSLPQLFPNLPWSFSQTQPLFELGHNPGLTSVVPSAKGLLPSSFKLCWETKYWKMFTYHVALRPRTHFLMNQI